MKKSMLGRSFLVGVFLLVSMLFGNGVNANNTIAQATPITFGEEIIVSTTNGVSDYYTFSVNETSKVTISMSNSTEAIWYYKLFDANEKFYIEDAYTTDNVYAVTPTQSQVILEPGEYYLSVSGVFSWMAAREQTYFFTVNAETVANDSSSLLFPDVPKDFWGHENISWGVANGIINGYPDGTFKPNEMVTTHQAATMLNRMNGHIYPGIGNHNPITRGDFALLMLYFMGYTDVEEAVGFLIGWDITTANSLEEFLPNDTLTRAQSVAFLQRYAESTR